MTKLIYVALFSLLLVGCKTRINLAIDSVETISVAYYSGHERVEETEFGKGSRELKDFKLWMSQNIDGWEKYYATQAIGNIYIKGDGFTLNVGPGWVVLNYEQPKDNYSQLYKPVAAGEFGFLNNAKKP